MNDEGFITSHFYFRLLSLIMAVWPLCGCAQQRVFTRSDDSLSTAHEQSYVTDAFQIDKSFESRDTAPEYMFFYKDCQVEKRRVHVSRIEYSCKRIPYQLD